MQNTRRTLNLQSKVFLQYWDKHIFLNCKISDLLAQRVKVGRFLHSLYFFYSVFSGRIFAPFFLPFTTIQDNSWVPSDFSWCTLNLCSAYCLMHLAGHLCPSLFSGVPASACLWYPLAHFSYAHQNTHPEKSRHLQKKNKIPSFQKFLSDWITAARKEKWAAFWLCCPTIPFQRHTVKPGKQTNRGKKPVMIVFIWPL